jgi:hypothetical protein
MYYDNKSAFYMKQYGPAIIVTVLSVALIGSGIYIYLKSDNINKSQTHQEQVASVASENKTENKPVAEESNNLKVEKTVSTTKTVSDELNSLNILQKSSIYKVETITDAGSLIIGNGSTKEEIYLIGVDFNNCNKDIIQKMRNDLSSKDVQIAFDAQKIENSKMYGYVYVDNTIYNEDLLKSGYAKLRVERNNINLLDKLLKAQLEAKNTSLGIWS